MYFKWTVITIVLIYKISISGIQSLNIPKTEKVAVVEYHPYSGHAGDIIEMNMKGYLDIINSISKDVSMIVFPESTLTYGLTPSNITAPLIPTNEYMFDLCLSSDPTYFPFLQNFSCVAKERGISLIINMWTRVKHNKTISNHDEPSLMNDNYNYDIYNTDVVFNDKGHLVSYYFKYNVYAEEGISIPTPKAVTFKINEITYGVFTCFDILFSKPALILTKYLNISHIIYPTMWYSELPFLTSLQVQQMWAYENNVVLLAAGASNPHIGSGGSGIFLGKNGPLNTSFLTTEKHSVIIEDIPTQINHIEDKANLDINTDQIDELAKKMDKVVFLKDNLNDYKSEILPLNKSTVVLELCNGGLCCNFHIELTYKDTGIGDKYVYHMVSFSGNRTFGGGFVKAGIQVCSIVACKNKHVSSCGDRFSNYTNVVWPVIFKSISIQATFENSNETIQFPNSLLSSIQPISPIFTCWTTEEVGFGSLRKIFNLTKPQEKIMSFGIYGRDFRNDIFT